MVVELDDRQPRDGRQVAIVGDEGGGADFERGRELQSVRSAQAAMARAQLSRGPQNGSAEISSAVGNDENFEEAESGSSRGDPSSVDGAELGVQHHERRSFST